MWSERKRERFILLLDQLQVYFGGNLRSGKCSERFLAKVIDPEHEPYQPIREWKRKKSIPCERYLIRIAEILGVEYENLMLHLEGSLPISDITNVNNKDTNLGITQELIEQFELLNKILLENCRDKEVVAAQAKCFKKLVHIIFSGGSNPIQTGLYKLNTRSHSS